MFRLPSSGKSKPLVTPLPKQTRSHDHPAPANPADVLVFAARTCFQRAHPRSVLDTLVMNTRKPKICCGASGLSDGSLWSPFFSRRFSESWRLFFSNSFIVFQRCNFCWIAWLPTSDFCDEHLCVGVSTRSPLIRVGKARERRSSPQHESQAISGRSPDTLGVIHPCAVGG